MPVASRRAIDGGGRPGGWGIKENHLHLSDSSNLKFLQDSLDTGAILLMPAIMQGAFVFSISIIAHSFYD